MQWWIDFKIWFNGLFAAPTPLPTPQLPDPAPPRPPDTYPPAQLGIQAPISWELPCSDSQLSQGAHPERRSWSNTAYDEIEKSYDLWSTANDAKLIIPQIDKLTRPQVITCFVEMLSGIAKYESSWNEATFSKDVNGSNEPALQANGLFQMNQGADQTNYHTGTNYTYVQLRTAIPNIITACRIFAYVIKMRGKIMIPKGEGGNPSVFFATLHPGGLYDKSEIILKSVHAMADKFNTTNVVIPPKDTTSVVEQDPPWYTEAKKYEGKTETDPVFSKFMIGRIYDLFKMRTSTIATSTWAWCGFAMAVALAGAGYHYAPNGEMARNWGKEGVAIEWHQVGIPKGALIWLNHTHDCSNDGSNHVGQANGKCTVQDFFTADGKLKPGASIDVYGGNTDNTWQTKTYDAREICAVRWPDKKADGSPVPLPNLPITESVNCTTGVIGKVNTR